MEATSALAKPPSWLLVKPPTAVVVNEPMDALPMLESSAVESTATWLLVRAMMCVVSRPITAALPRYCTCCVLRACMPNEVNPFS